MPTLAEKTIVERKGENVSDRQHDGVTYFKDEVSVEEEVPVADDEIPEGVPPADSELFFPDDE